MVVVTGYYVVEGNCLNLSECTCTYSYFRIFCSICGIGSVTRGNSGELAHNKVQRAVVQCLVLHGKTTLADDWRASRNISTIPTSDKNADKVCSVRHQVVVRYRD